MQTLARLDRLGRLIAAGWLAVMIGTLVYIMLRPLDFSLDLRVYRVGGEAWLKHFPIYVDGFAKPLGGPDLPFTYPPVAAMIFSLLALVPLAVAVFAVAFVNLAALTTLCLIAAARVCGWGPDAVKWGLGAAAVASIFDPLRETLWFGQINLMLGVLVMADCLLARTRWPRGALIGLAAAIKLTPAFFALYFVARREWRPVFVAVGSFAAFGLIGFLVAPSDARQYWFHALLDPSRVGRLTYTANQSLRGLLARLFADNTTQVVVWVVLSLLIVVAAYVVATWARRAGDDLVAFLAVATGGLLISPVSWGHHWVWIAPALVLLARPELRRGKAFWAGFLPMIVVFALGPHWWFPNDNDVERNWAWWQQVIGNAYVWAGLGVLVTLSLLALRRKSLSATAAGS
ncbi:membrane protein [Lentzea sp. NBRC 105346]|uniref:glycosyltransferase 87 family protein n=1 Tax=Lentzea sp. NBRC 105346 TaxID=3032205 RepID=UPI0024A0B00B|nr:glycosyltransferase 87 family protein [Lentzea sp. NBRC 105346]GLZ29453.1 membrane protein [Lentzea sp. NBRC 105346]